MIISTLKLTGDHTGSANTYLECPKPLKVDSKYACEDNSGLALLRRNSWANMTCLYAFFQPPFKSSL